MNDKKGFTLIEVMIIAAFIALLAAVIIPLIAKGKARLAASEQRQISIAGVTPLDYDRYLVYFRSGHSLVPKIFGDRAGTTKDGTTIVYDGIRLQDDAEEGHMFLSFVIEKEQVIAIIHVSSVSDLTGKGWAERKNNNSANYPTAEYK
jgi:hypothetical protein